MRNDELERRLRTAAEHAAPNVLDQVLSSCVGQKGTVIAMETPKKKKLIPAFAALAAMLVCAAAFVLFPTQQASASAAVITFDVNPSLSLTVDAGEHVVEAIPLNDDGRVVLEDMDLTGSDLNVAVNAVIGSMLQHGYLDLDNFENAILISVESGDADRAAQLQQQVSNTISGAFQADDPLILTQTVAVDNDLAALAEQYGISQGKAALIREVTAQDSTLTFQTLAPLTINEIALIANSRGLSTGAATQTGQASEAAYIGAQAALDYACNHTGIPVSGVLDPKVEFDCENGIMVYEAEFCYDGTEYEYDIDARTGAVLHFHHELCDHSSHAGHHQDDHHSGQFTQPSAPVPSFSVPTAPSATPPSVSAPVPSSTPVPTAPSAIPEPIPAPSNLPTPAPAAYIGETAAQNAAFTHVGCAAGDVSFLTCHLEYDDGVPECYEVEFCHNGSQYEYEIGLYDGSILAFGHEACTNGLHGHHSGNSGNGHHGSGHHGWSYGQGNGQARIGLAAARDAALTHAGVSAADAFELEAELDTGDNVYEVEFKANGYEYEYEIDAYSGAVVKYEQDLDG